MEWRTPCDFNCFQNHSFLTWGLTTHPQTSYPLGSREQEAKITCLAFTGQHWALGTYLSWLRMRAVKVDAIMPTQPEMAHQGFCTKRPRAMRRPLRGLFTNITWDRPRSTQSRNWNTGDLSEMIGKVGGHSEQVRPGLGLRWQQERRSSGP